MSLEHTAIAAAQTFTLDELTASDLLGKGLTVALNKNLYPFGQESSLQLIFEKGVPAGMIYRFRKDKLFSSLMIVGLYFDSDEEFTKFITPVINQTLAAAKGL